MWIVAAYLTDRIQLKAANTWQYEHLHHAQAKARHIRQSGFEVKEDDGARLHYGAHKIDYVAIREAKEDDPPNDAPRLPRQYTTDEVQERFLQKVWSLVSFWSDQTSPREPAYGYMMDLAANILALLDGEDADLPPFIVQPAPAADAKSARQRQKLDWYPEHTDLPFHNIAGFLHGNFRNLTKSAD